MARNSSNLETHWTVKLKQITWEEICLKALFQRTIAKKGCHNFARAEFQKKKKLENSGERPMLWLQPYSPLSSIKQLSKIEMIKVMCMLKTGVAHKHVEVFIQKNYCSYPIKVIKNKHLPACMDSLWLFWLLCTV